MESGPDLPENLSNKLKTSLKKSLDKAISPATRKNLHNSVKTSVKKTKDMMRQTLDSTIKKAKKTGANLSARIDSVSAGITGKDSADLRIAHPKKRVPLAERLNSSKEAEAEEEPEPRPEADIEAETEVEVESEVDAAINSDIEEGIKVNVSSKSSEYFDKTSKKIKKNFENSTVSLKEFFTSTIGALKRGMKKDLDEDNSHESENQAKNHSPYPINESNEVSHIKLADNNRDNKEDKNDKEDLKPKVIYSVGVYKPEKAVEELYEDLKKLSKKSEKGLKSNKIDNTDSIASNLNKIESHEDEEDKEEDEEILFDSEDFVKEKQIEQIEEVVEPIKNDPLDETNSTINLAFQTQTQTQTPAPTHTTNTIVSTVSSLFSRSKPIQSNTLESAHSNIYADYASLTPIDPRVKKVMFDAIDMYSANPSSLYKSGVQAKKALEDARASVAAFFGSNKDEIIFTSGGTETNNMVFKGVLKAFEENGSTMDSKKVIEKKLKQGEKIQAVKPHFIISTIEHPSIIEIALEMINQGIDVSFIPVNQDGIIDPKDIKKTLRPETVLISIMYANNEIGTIQPLKEIAREVRHYKKSLGRDNLGYPYIHSDACQAALYEDMRILSLNIDLMTIDGGKVYGPRGTGVLVKRRHVQISPILLGGSQELGLRAGTENVPAIIGLKHALDIAHNEREDESARLFELRETLLEMIMSKLQSKMNDIFVNGSLAERLPNNLNICFPGIDAEFLVLRLDVLGVELSSVTSCRATNEDSSSYVIEAIGRPDCALSSLRISLGRFTTSVDIGNIADRIVDSIVEQTGSLKS